MLDRAARIEGCIKLGALGDAWGAPYENRQHEFEFSPPKHPVITDDTQLTLATCEVIADGNLSPETLAANFGKWFKSGRVSGLGSAGLKALRELAQGAHWAIVGRKGEYAAGSGAAMRAAPLGFVLDPDDMKERLLLRDIARITHHNDEAYAGLLAIVAAVRGALNGRWASGVSFLELAREQMPDTLVREKVDTLLSSDAPLDLYENSPPSGHVVDTVPLALAAAELVRDDQPLEILVEVIELGGDTDTVASMTGQLMGAAVGMNQDVRQAFDRMAERALIEDVVAKTADAIGLSA